MKILHTSDWHLGQTFYSYDRIDEHVYFFNQLMDILRYDQPDALVVSGDIFDITNPSASVSKLFKDTILSLHALVPEMKIIITAGNHDSASRIDIDRNLWKLNGIHVIGGLDRKDGVIDFSDNIIEVGNKGFVVALPFVNRMILSKIENGREITIFQRLAEEVEKRNPDNLPVVLMAHLTIADCDMRGHRNLNMGGIDSVNADIFGPYFDYVALGHIHQAQSFLDGRIAYSGTPVAVSFDEAQRHTISNVNVKRGELPEIEQIEVKSLRELKTVPEEGVEFKKALRALSRIPDSELSYVRLNVAQTDDLPVDCMEQAMAMTRNKNCRFCTIKYTQVKGDIDTAQLPRLQAFEFVEMSPVEVASSYFRSSGVDEEKIKDYIEILEQLHRELIDEEN